MRQSTIQPRIITCLITGLVTLLLFAAPGSGFAQTNKGTTDTVKTGNYTGSDTAIAGLDSVIAPPDTVNAADQEDSALDAAGVSDSDNVAGNQPRTYRRVADTTFARERKDPAFAYAFDPAYWKKEKEDTDSSVPWIYYIVRFFQLQAVRYIIYLLLAAIVVFVIYRVASDNNFRFFGSRSRKAGTGGEENESLEEEDLEAGLRLAKEQGDLRAATRYLYLISLRKLDQAGLISFHPETSDQDYISKMKDHSQGQDFAFLARVFQRVWYGGFTLSTSQFDQVQDRFQQFTSSLKSS